MKIINSRTEDGCTYLTAEFASLSGAIELYVEDDCVSPFLNSYFNVVGDHDQLSKYVFRFIKNYEDATGEDWKVPSHESILMSIEPNGADILAEDGGEFAHFFFLFNTVSFEVICGKEQGPIWVGRPNTAKIINGVVSSRDDLSVFNA